MLLLELRDLLRKVIADNPDPPAKADIDQLRERLSREFRSFIIVCGLPTEAGRPELRDRIQHCDYQGVTEAYSRATHDKLKIGIRRCR